MIWKIHQIKVNLLLYRINNRSSNPRQILKIQSKITKYIELDYLTYTQMEFISFHGERSPEDIQDDIETYIKHRSKAQNIEYALKLVERVFPQVEEQYDFLYGIFQTLLKLEKFSDRIQNIMSYLLRLKIFSPNDFDRFHLFRKSELHETILEDCTSVDDYNFLFDQMVVYFIETEVKSNPKNLSPQIKLVELQTINGNKILFHIWQKIVELQGQIEGDRIILPVEQFKRVHNALQEQNISDHEQYYFLMDNFSANLQLRFLEYCCLTPEIYEKIHGQVTWPEMEEVYHQLFNIPLSDNRGVIL